MCRGQGCADLIEGGHGGCHWRCHLMHVLVGIRSIFLHKFPFLFGCILYLYFGLFLPEIYLWKKIYLVNRLETNCRKSLIPFHTIWGLCWYNLFFVPKHVYFFRSTLYSAFPFADILPRGGWPLLWPLSWAFCMSSLQWTGGFVARGFWWGLRYDMPKSCKSRDRTLWG